MAQGETADRCHSPDVRQPDLFVSFILNLIIFIQSHGYFRIRKDPPPRYQTKVDRIRQHVQGA